jgi:imidazole glycerol-phosphate synthase subunit HisF
MEQHYCATGWRTIMLTKRIIPCLDIKDGRVVKGQKFSNLKDAGDPVELALRYQDEGADEIVLLDVSATLEGRVAQVETIRKVRSALGIPLTAGGGIRTADDTGRLLEAGADKVSVNTAAVRNPELLSEIAARYGRQCAVLAIDAVRVEGSLAWRVLVDSGKTDTGLCAIEWAIKAVNLGAGEILLTSWDRDGTGSGYDVDLIGKVADAVSVPVIASGGANSPEDLLAGFLAGADAVLAASIFHFGLYSVRNIKEYLQDKIEVRPC